MYAQLFVEMASELVLKNVTMEIFLMGMAEIAREKLRQGGNVVEAQVST